MVSSADEQHDALILLRSSIASNSAVLPGTSTDPTSASADLNLSRATHLHFTSPSAIALPLASPTRFYSTDNAVDLRSIFFAWQNREAPIPAYAAAVVTLNADLRADGAAGGAVKQLAFVERLDLITWLEGGQEESEYIKPLTSRGAAAPGASQSQSASAGAPKGEKKPKEVSERLLQIYAGERKTGDRNSVLRGIKPTVSPSPAPYLPLFMLHESQPNVPITGFLTRPQNRTNIHQDQVRPPRPKSRRTEPHSTSQRQTSTSP